MTTSNEHNNAPAVQVYQLAKLGGPTETAWIDVTQEDYEDAGFYKDDFKRRILSATPAPVPAVPQGWKLVMVEDGAPANEPDWDEVKRQAEVSTGIPINQPTYSIIIREIRRWLIQRDTAVPSKPAVPMSESQRADMICAVAAICTGTSSRTVAATAIEWVERYYGITTPAATPAPAPAQERCSTCGYLTSEREHLGCLRRAVKDLDIATGGPYDAQGVGLTDETQTQDELHSLRLTASGGAYVG